MPTNYAGSTVIGGGMRPPRSFLDEEFTEDERMRQWAEATDRISGKEIEGSDFYQTEAADPSKGFLGAYVARKKSTGLPTDMAVDAKPMMSTDNRYIAPRLTNRQAIIFRDDYKKDMDKQSADADRAKAKAEADAEAQRLSAQRMAEARQKAELELEVEAKRRNMAKENPNFGEQAAAMQIAEANRMRAEAEQKRTRQEGRRSVLATGQDIPGYTEAGERAAAEAIAQGATVEEAEAIAAAATRKEMQRIEELESSGVPSNIRVATEMRKRDPDLRKLRSFIPERNKANEEAAFDTVMNEGGSLMDDIVNRIDKEDVSWDFWNDNNDPLSDMNATERAQIAANVNARIRKLKQLSPALAEDMTAIKDMLWRRARERNLTTQQIQELMAMVQ